jgi:SulP family sulfate permease
VTLAAYGIPVSLAYASLAGLPPQYGIYCYLVGGLFYALFGSSRQLAIGPTSAISMLVGVTVAGMAQGDPGRWASIAALTALCIAVMCVLAWLFRLSSLVNFISETILLGFKAGAALTIAMTQLPKLFGVQGGGHGFFESVVTLAGQLPDTNLAVLAFGLAALAVLLLGEKFLPGRPVALVVVIVSIILLSLTPLGELGFKIVGALPQGLPDFQLPDLRVRDVDGRDPARLRLPVAGLRRKRVCRPRPGAGARLRDRCAPGTSRPGCGEPGCGPLPGLPGGRRPVAVVGERQGRRQDTARAGFRLGDDRPCA